SGGNVDVGFVPKFGTSVALSGDTLAVGAPGESGCATGVNGDQTESQATVACRLSGAVYVFTRTNGSWTQQAYLKASTLAGSPFVNFGESLALIGDTLVVGAPREASCARGINGDQFNNACPSAGAMYVFTRTAGVWSQQAYVKASNTKGGNAFGSSVALAGEELAVDNADDVLLFTRTNGIWASDGSVTPSISGSSLGQTLALNDNLLVVGKPGEIGCTHIGCERAGAVYTFTRFSDGIWSGVFYNQATNTDAEDRFGTSVALSNELLAIGAPFESSCAAGVNGNQADNNCYAAGAAYTYASQ